MMYNTLRHMIQEFVDNSRPTALNDAAPCTVKDMNRMLENLSKLLNDFVDEVEYEIEPESVPDD